MKVDTYVTSEFVRNTTNNFWTIETVGTSSIIIFTMCICVWCTTDVLCDFDSNTKLYFYSIFQTYDKKFGFVDFLISIRIKHIERYSETSLRLCKIDKIVVVNYLGCMNAMLHAKYLKKITLTKVLLVRMDSRNRYSVYEIIPTNIKEDTRLCLYFLLTHQDDKIIDFTNLYHASF